MSKLIVVSFEFYESVFIYSLEQKEEEFCHYCTAVISASILDSGNTQKSIVHLLARLLLCSLLLLLLD